MLTVVLAVIAVIWVIIAWGVVIVVLKRGWGPYFRSKRQPVTRVNAIIRGKQGKQEVNPLTWQPEITQKVLVFGCDDGVQRDYEVHDDIWDWVETGDDGVLVYQGDLFVRFEARRPRHDMDKVYSNLTRS